MPSVAEHGVITCTITYLEKFKPSKIPSAVSELVHDFVAVKYSWRRHYTGLHRHHFRTDG